MDFPIFHLDGMGNRALIAVIAITHVLINHAFAVGALPLIAYLERKGIKSGDERWDQLAYKLLFICFVITTTLGAMTGVGIWFSASLINPYSIGSLLRIFFWGWFAEWLVFITEVCLIMAYFLTWKSWQGERKAAHQRLGWSLAAFSWITMALIVAVLAFMMSSGHWSEQRTFWSAFLNPLYFPQLGFRTFLALASGGLFALAALPFLTSSSPDGIRGQATRVCATWTILALFPLTLGGYWYWKTIPDAMTGNLAVALTTLEFSNWYGSVLKGLGAAVIIIFLCCLWAIAIPRKFPAGLALLPFLITLGLLGTFERIREFIRKPYVIPQYMYANGYRIEDYPLLQKEGVLKHAAFSPITKISDQNRVQSGRQVFLLTCSRCHTTTGVNGVIPKFEALLGDKPWTVDSIANYTEQMHGARPFMPPFPGNAEELEALANYILYLQKQPEASLGAQNAGMTAMPQEQP